MIDNQDRIVTYDFQITFIGPCSKKCYHQLQDDQSDKLRQN